MALFDLLGRRWAMGVLWNLAPRGPSTSCPAGSLRKQERHHLSVHPQHQDKRTRRSKASRARLQGYELTPSGTNSSISSSPSRTGLTAGAGSLRPIEEAGSGTAQFPPLAYCFMAEFQSRDAIQPKMTGAAIPQANQTGGSRPSAKRAGKLVITKMGITKTPIAWPMRL